MLCTAVLASVRKVCKGSCGTGRVFVAELTCPGTFSDTSRGLGPVGTCSSRGSIPLRSKTQTCWLSEDEETRQVGKALLAWVCTGWDSLGAGEGTSPLV